MNHAAKTLNHEPDAGGASRALDKGLSILEMLSAAREPAGLTAIAARVKLGKASALRLLRTLEVRGYIRREGDHGYLLGGSWPSRERETCLSALREIAPPVMERLNSQFGETVALAFLFGDVIRVIEVRESLHHIRMSNYPGRILQPYASSLGKAISAFQTPQTVQRLLEVYGIYRLTPDTICDPAAIREELGRVRKRGYSTDRAETVAGGHCFGAPIYAGPASVVAAISLSLPGVRLTPQIEEILPRTIVRAARDISAELKKLLPAAS